MFHVHLLSSSVFIFSLNHLKFGYLSTLYLNKICIRLVCKNLALSGCRCRRLDLHVCEFQQ